MRLSRIVQSPLSQEPSITELNTQGKQYFPNHIFSGFRNLKEHTFIWNSHLNYKDLLAFKKQELLVLRA